MSIKVLVVDDHYLVRTGLIAILTDDKGIDIIGEAASGEEAIRKSLELHPDIIIMDISMPGLSGLEAAEEILTQRSNTRVLFLTIHDDQALVRKTIEIGASGYILKNAVEAELISAIRAVAHDEMYVDSALTRALFHNSHSKHFEPEFTNPLTPRETQIIKLIAKGYTNRQIAEKFCISVRTVESHRANLTDKLNLTNRADLIKYVHENGFMD